VLNSKPKIIESPDAKDFEYKSGGIKFKDLSFKHITGTEEKEDGKVGVNNRQLLNDFNLEIEPGTSNAIVGSSGFGKTTLFNLLFRIYDPDSGTILLDDQDVKTLKFDTFR
jgi:ABC-type multidrug transport system fused ATPase/permease subunit